MEHEHSKSVFIMLVRCLLITAEGFIILSGISSGPVAFLGFTHLISILIHSFLASGKLYFLGLGHFFSNPINT